jgi:glycerophosphoryl diester phosphodiesterase
MYPRRGGGRRPWLCGHRGHSVGAPENTLASIRAAAAAGGDIVEIDLRLAADGACVLLHDATLDRTTNGHGLVSAHSRAQLAAIDAGAWFASAFAGERVPSLQEAAALAHNLGLALQVEIKEYGRDEAVFQALAALPAAAWQGIGCISSFDWSQLAAAAARFPGVPMLAILHGREPLLAPWLRDRGLAAISLEYPYVQRTDLEACRAAGLAVSVTLPRPPVLEDLARYGDGTRHRLLAMIREGLIDQLVSDDVAYMAAFAEEARAPE